VAGSHQPVDVLATAKSIETTIHRLSTDARKHHAITMREKILLASALAKLTNQYGDPVRILHRLPQRERGAPDGDAVVKDGEGEAGWYETMKQSVEA
jgi:hypothetical protein